MGGKGRPLTEAGNFVLSQLFRGVPLTSIETTLLAGYADLGMLVSRLRRNGGGIAIFADGAPIKDRKVPYRAVFARVAKTLGAPLTAKPLVNVSEDHEFTEYFWPMEYVPLRRMRVSDEKRIVARLRGEVGLALPSFEAIALVRRAEEVAQAADERARKAKEAVKRKEAGIDLPPEIMTAQDMIDAATPLPVLRENAAALAAAAVEARDAVDAVVLGLRPDVTKLPAPSSAKSTGECPAAPGACRRRRRR